MTGQNDDLRNDSTCPDDDIDAKPDLTLKHKLSEHTIAKANQGFKRFNILENNVTNNPGVIKRHSVVLNDEYDDSASDNNSNTTSLPVSKTNSISTSTSNSTPPLNSREIKVSPSGISLENETGMKETKSTVPQAKPCNSVAIHVSQSKVRFKKDGKMRSNFGDFAFIPRDTIFDREIQFGAKFYGFFVAFWICVFFFGINVTCGYHLSHGSLLRSEIVKLMIKDLWKVALTDLIMYLSMYTSPLIQLAIKSNLIRWKYTGYILQSIYEIALLCYSIHFAAYMDFPWIAQIFLMLHSCVMLMKVHSYAFFNGYLWEITSELKFSTYFVNEKLECLSDKITTALNNSIQFCNSEISSQNFPHNISIFNFFEYSMFPVLVYQYNYPRTERIRVGYLLTKILGIFGIILLIISISQNKLYPIVMYCLEMQQTTTLWYRITQYPSILIDTIPPFLTVYLLTFYLIWELILNAIAELSRFADREFYGYWWNSVDWNEYARDWNVPVHKFLLRHVYHSSISAFKVNKTAATFFTFFLSSIIHELAMYVIFKKIRFYLLLLQMSQLSLVQLSKTKWMKGKNVLGNCIFWFGIVFGPSLMCTMYLVF